MAERCDICGMECEAVTDCIACGRQFCTYCGDDGSGICHECEAEDEAKGYDDDEQDD